MPIRDTSAFSLDELERSGKQESLKRKVLVTIQRLKRGTDAMIDKFSGINDRRTSAPRRNELMREGLVEADGKDICKVTGKLVYYWKLSEKGVQALDPEYSVTISRDTSENVRENRD